MHDVLPAIGSVQAIQFEGLCWTEGNGSGVGIITRIAK